MVFTEALHSSLPYLSIQEDSDVEWLEGPRDSSANEELFNRVESLYFFVTQTFTPSAIAMSLTRGGVKVWIYSNLPYNGLFLKEFNFRIIRRTQLQKFDSLNIKLACARSAKFCPLLNRTPHLIIDGICPTHLL